VAVASALPGDDVTLVRDRRTPERGVVQPGDLGFASVTEDELGDVGGREADAARSPALDQDQSLAPREEVDPRRQRRLRAGHGPEHVPG